ncbi:hypothetical protein CYLTODRAFT_488443 [Cylindrobasidium torrendii FP15055 ss-10]|uniref:Uncharacterized protein n=1 Tax=Cylindrobasidium torrendii FP15055 ss-10 TaxID=1314674 RepID=A0A0D7BK24_9AGAR|nr:hypothetical protein CYLTODRAFT_488443 [Cylindrobasidium torrendii FP15055 ss-10]
MFSVMTSHLPHMSAPRRALLCTTWTSRGVVYFAVVERKPGGLEAMSDTSVIVSVGRVPGWFNVVNTYCYALGALCNLAKEDGVQTMDVAVNSEDAAFRLQSMIQGTNRGSVGVYSADDPNHFLIGDTERLLHLSGCTFRFNFVPEHRLRLSDAVRDYHLAVLHEDSEIITLDDYERTILEVDERIAVEALSHKLGQTCLDY